ncbi:ABC transporter ATP-binding protein [Natronolimnohabitans innermongolicus]|uniref:ABC transporter-like protein n=1 Tax=Natronolimnohabitans innermongolicus JCM 12255 TaxID=1227499 RepID=L9WTN5_9EURY|nr:ABC transporter ATP-binding protein [Natronolimnohabitans innermongolicus]ELY52566.1 ABC transporter-like protein [Natronolimnohabitans innermongolicus JCM 12255]
MAAIELEGLTKEYGEVVANDDVSFTVERGEIFGYLGPNGAGKTTTIRLLLGFISPTAGGGRILGRDITDERELIEAKRRIGYLPDDPQFDESATGREVLEVHAGIKGDERSDELLELFDPPLDRPIREYSHGNVRKLGLVTTFMHDPELVILDEPTSGLDPLMKQRFADFVRAERDRGLTLFFSSHILGEVRRLCDRVGIIRAGNLVTVEPIDALLHRSGKVVRVVTADSVPRSTFEDGLEGVHDLEVGGGDALDDAAVDAADSSPGGYREHTFTFTGAVDDLLAAVGEYDLVDLTIEEAPLESVFLRFYGGDEGV